jgi:hypothetical protein
MPDASSTIYVPEDHKALLARALELIEACNISRSIRAAYYRQLYAVSETGRTDGTRAKINKLHKHLDRLQSHLFSPTDLRFNVDYEYQYPKEFQQRAMVAAKVITQDWERTNTDTLFGQGVFESLRYGSSFLKQWPEQSPGDKIHYRAALVMPWNLGVTNERHNSLDDQDAICETITLTMPEVWKRIHNLPDANKLFNRIQGNAKKGEAGGEETSFFHQILSTAQISTGVQGLTHPIPGGVVQLNNDPNYAVMGPELGVETVKMYELWVKDKDDYKTIQVIDPDVLVSPRPQFKLSNLLISGAEHSFLHPYTRICSNDPHGYMWGRSELVDLIEPQGLLATWCDDTVRLYGLQVDRILGFIGDDGLNDEKYDQFRAAGYINLQPGSDIKDLTPQMPPMSLEMINLASTAIDEIGGFDNVMNGQGQTGVRSADHGELLKQMASPMIRDRALLLERQCAQAADLRLSIREAKDDHRYWTDGENEKTIEATGFNLTDLPEDRRVTVDSHSSSPIFRDSHTQLLFALAKMQAIDPLTLLENVDLPNKDISIERLKEREEQQKALMQQLMQKDPQALEKILAHKGGHK